MIHAIKYLKKSHFTEILKDKGINPDNFIFQRLSEGAASFENVNGDYFVIYANTIVLAKEKSKVTLDTRGRGKDWIDGEEDCKEWQTNTSKRWINHGLSHIKSGRYICQIDYTWYLAYTAETMRGKREEYINGMTI